MLEKKAHEEFKDKSLKVGGNDNANNDGDDAVFFDFIVG